MQLHYIPRSIKSCAGTAPGTGSSLYHLLWADLTQQLLSGICTIVKYSSDNKKQAGLIECLIAFPIFV